VDDVHFEHSGCVYQKRRYRTITLGHATDGSGGKDSQVFGFSATAPNLPGYRGLRHVGLANVSSLAPVGKGLTLQGGIFSSLIGYDLLYAKDNLSYTRPWGS
jgi:Putative beta-barrel porin-2, OmpL-like. bbp2